ncbi:MAG: hypothetical protein ACKOAX_06400 [Candidatus Kapaibacterium sp.]
MNGSRHTRHACQAWHATSRAFLARFPYAAVIATAALVTSLSPIAFTGCMSGTGITQPQDVVFPDSNVRYLQHVQPLLQLGCAFNGCHAAGSRIPLDSYIALFQTPGLVIPGKPESSMLVQVITGVLPHTYPLVSITENHRRGIATWVREGANNN